MLNLTRMIRAVLMNTSARFMALVFGMLVAVTALLTPRPEERLAVLQDEGKRAVIISLLEPRLDQNPDDPGHLATLARAYAEDSVYDRAIELMKRYVALRPEDADGYGSLADLYKKTGDVAGQIGVLESSVAIAPKMSRVLELAALYRQAQRPKAEVALLSRFERELKLASGALLRLGELRDGAGDRERAIEGLMRNEVLSDRPRTAQQAEARLFLARLLSDAGRSAELVRLGKQWLLQWHEPWLADRLLRGVALQAPTEAASQLADAVVELHPEIRLFLVRGLAGMGAKPLARHLLETWIDANPSPSVNEISAFLSGCREQDELPVAWQAFAAVLHRGQSEIVTRFTKAIVASFGVGALAPFWASLPPIVMQRNPLLAAQLAFHQDDLKTTNWLLTKVDLASLPKSDRRIWIELLTAAASPSDAFAVLRQRRLSGNLPNDLLSQYARLARGLGQEMEFRAAIADLAHEPH
jgi:tetratricopeptide (TPR) repeat protein